MTPMMTSLLPLANERARLSGRFAAAMNIIDTVYFMKNYTREGKVRLGIV